MQRLTDIATRRREIAKELAELDREEAEIHRALEATAAVDPQLVAIVLRSNTQHGCAEAQALLETAAPSERAALFTGTLTEVRALLSDPFSALFVQKLLESADPSEISRFLDALGVGSVLVDVTSTTSGSRIVQRFMDLMRSPECCYRFTNLVCANIVALSNNANASHIVQRALTNRFTSDKDQLVNAIIRDMIPIATDKQGCCVLQRAIDWLGDAERERIIAAVIVNEVELVQDAFGNYVVQHLLERNDDELTRRTIQPLLHNIAGLACNKFSSNVIEKCVRAARPAVKQLLIDELTDPSVLPRLVQDSFANYVIQTAISSSNDEQFQQLHAAIRPCFSILKNSPYGVRIDAKIQRRLKDNARAKQRKKKQEGPTGVQQVAYGAASDPTHQQLAVEFGYDQHGHHQQQSFDNNRRAQNGNNGRPQRAAENSQQVPKTHLVAQQPTLLMHPGQQMMVGFAVPAHRNPYQQH